MAEDGGGVLFSPEDLADQMGVVELLSAMWSADGELVVTEQDERAIRAVSEYLQLPVASLGDATSLALKAEIPAAVEMTLVVKPDVQLHDMQVGLVVTLPLRRRPQGGDGYRAATLRIASLSTASRSTMDDLVRILAQLDNHDCEGENDTVSLVMSAVELLSEHILTLPPINDVNRCTNSAHADTAQTATAVRRSWYYLPSLSSRDKRSDIVDAATTFIPVPLTGFLLAGKPGLIVLEHPLYADNAHALLDESSTKAAHALDTFWSNIKSRSWSDIPSSHKKISEKLTEAVCTNGAAFDGFHDITHWPETERAPDRGRKTDLSKLVTWLESRGIDGKVSIEKCLGVGWTQS